MMGDTSGKQTRRRGAALDHALLTAAWDELIENGYENFTLESVADRADTSRPVIFRRWSDRRALVMAAMRHWFEQNPLTGVDTGTLRGDLLAYLEEKSTKRAELRTVFLLRLAAFIRESPESAAQFQEQVGQSMTSDLDKIWQRAAARGEVELDTLSPRIRALPFDLVGAELARTHQPVPRATIEEILDTIILPLTTRR